MFWDCRVVIVKQYVITVTIMQGSQNYFILIVTQCNSAACLRIFVCPSLSGDLVRLVHLADCWQTLLLIQMLNKRYSWFLCCLVFGSVKLKSRLRKTKSWLQNSWHHNNVFVDVPQLEA